MNLRYIEHRLLNKYKTILSKIKDPIIDDFINKRIIVKDTCYNKDLIGLKGIIIDTRYISPHEIYGVKFDYKIICGHDCNGKCGSEYGHYIPIKDVEFI